jgi:hypothetical protein
VLPNDKRKIAVKLKNEAWTIPRAREATLAAGQDFSRSILRSDKILLQSNATLRNAQIGFVPSTYDSQCCATQRKRTQFVRLELQISCSNQLSYAGKNTAHINGRCRVKQVADRVVLVSS